MKMVMRFFIAIGALSIAGLIAANRAMATDPGVDWCRVPDALIRADSSLLRVAEAIDKNQPIKIVVLGTMSSVGMGSGVSAVYHSYPEKLREELSRRHSQLPITLVNLAQCGWTTVEMAAAIEDKVIPLKPTVVVWQTGSVEAVRGLDVNWMGEAIGSGIAKLRQGQSDVILIGPQYNPRAAAMINFEPYATYMQQIAQSRGIILFNRHDIMKYWLDEGIVKFDDPNRTLQRLNADQVHECLGQLLAGIIERAARRSSGLTPEASPW
jgi:hypothetical protein